ncbi:hypothetical protein JD844_019824 [Phrynosoma platyrhinos]|uniref:Zona pellucida sperm-binding protein 2 n=1 Tax=Phrynosoma platyrhinos TaxID=52577 RepID=A0ABQ7TQQ7_PHRPL|nr:hypothetical protein JD844_019824 [Phrynosoma platyrhinos]
MLLTLFLVSGNVSCHDDEIQIWLPKEFENSTAWQIEILDASGKEINDCQYAVDYEKQTVTAVYGNCTNLEHNKHHLRFRLQFNGTVMQDLKDETYNVGCDAVPADEAPLSHSFTSATNCTKDFMAVTFPRLIPSFHDEYAQDGHVLYTVALKLTYGPPEQRLTMESRMICAPGPATCNSTHMTITIPAFPGILTAVILDDKNIPLNQFQANGIGVDTRRGLQVFISKKDLKSRDGHMEFDILSNSTKPALNLDTLKLKDPACGPVFRSFSSNMVRFRVPLNGCGTKQRVCSSKLKLTVMCTYGSDDVSLNIKMSSLPPPESVVNQGPLSLILLIYPDDSYVYPYSDDQYPIVKYLRQPIFLEVQVLNRNDPNIHLMLDDCWATLSVDPSSLPRWNIVVDGCDYELDNYKTVFHPVGPAVSFSNFRQRFEVKAFAFVSDGKALPSLVFFHCSVIICDRLHPDSPLCSTRCPHPSRSKRDVAPPENAAIVTLPHAVILVPEEELDIKGPQKWSNGRWVTATLVAGVTISLLATALAGIACLKIQKKKTVLVN